MSDAAGKAIASGPVEGIDAQGRLLVGADGAQVAVAAGDVTLRGGSRD